MNRLLAGTLAVALLAFVAAPAWADADSDYADQMAALIKAIPGGKVPLDQGIKAAESQGRPISAQYEVDDGHFQLSVFTSKDADLLEIIVDHDNGNVATVENITDPDDIKDAKRQLRAMGKATTSLSDAVAAAAKANPGYITIRVVPKIENGDPIASITLLKGSDTKMVTQKLD